MEKISRLQICINNNEENHTDVVFDTKEYSKTPTSKNIEYEIQDNGKTLKVGVNE